MQEATLECKMGEEIDSHRSPVLPSPGFLPQVGVGVGGTAGSSEQRKKVESWIHTLAVHTVCLRHYDILHDEFCP